MCIRDRTEGLARELVKDSIDFDDVVKQHLDLLTKTCRSEITKFDGSRSDEIADEEQSINDTIFKLKLFRL